SSDGAFRQRALQLPHFDTVPSLTLQSAITLCRHQDWSGDNTRARKKRASLLYHKSCLVTRHYLCYNRSTRWEIARGCSTCKRPLNEPEVMSRSATFWDTRTVPGLAGHERVRVPTNFRNSRS